jgi:hypothetical protein
MAIYLDANVFPDRGSLPSLELATLVALAKESSLTVNIPEIVLEEVLSRYMRGVLTTQDKFQSAAAEAAKYWEVSSVYFPDPDELVSERRQALMKLVTFLPLESEDARDGILREIWRRRPAREGKGARDAAIWNSIVRHHHTADERGFFVSRNTKDFACPSGDSWASALSDEIAKCTEPLMYFNSPEKLFEELATPASLKLNRHIADTSDVLMQAVSAFVEDRHIYATSLTSSGLDGTPFLAAPVSAELQGIREVHSYVVADKTIAVAWTDWHVECRVGALRRFTRGGYGQSFYVASGACELQLILRLDSETGVPLSAEVTNSDRCNLVANTFE